MQQPHPPGAAPASGRRQHGWALVGVLVGLLAGVTFVGVVLYQQTHALSDHLLSVDPIVNGNVRVLGQTQRELLRLDGLVAAGVRDSRRLDLHRDLVSQRMRETSLSYQIDTLGDPELLAQARSIARRWWDEGVGLVRAVAAGGRAQRAALRTLIADLELAVNQLVSAAEISRRENAHTANATVEDLLGESRRLLVGGAFTAVLLVVCGVLAAVGFVRFDRQRTRTTEHLAELNDDLALLSEVAARTDAMVIITDGGGTTTWVNAAFSRLTGYAPEEIVGRRPGQVLQGPDTDPSTIDLMRSHVRAGQPFTCEVVNYTKGGDPYWVHIEVQPVTDERGAVTNFIAVQSDVTARREAEERLRAAKVLAEQTAAAKSNFLASMSHEIRTPLNAIIGLTSLLRATDLEGLQREYVDTAASSSQLLLGVINDILNYSSLEFGGVELESEPFAPRTLADETVQLLRPNASAKHVALHLHIDEQLAPVLIGDPTRIQQVLVNLVGNAVKFTDEGTVEVAVTALGERDGRQRVQWRVTDTGIGIPQALQDRLFQPFSQIDASTTRRFGGTGLGLAICKDLIGLMGGTIEVSSTPGVGTEFRVTLDLHVGAEGALAPAEPEVLDAQLLPRPDLRVLLAEDDAVNQTVALHMLQRLGLRADTANNGLEALDALAQADYDLVLMDVDMPVLDGPAATARIRADWPTDRQPVILAMTANALAGDRERFLAAGMDAYLAKPVQLRDLADALCAADTRTALQPTVPAEVPPAPATHAVPSPPVDVNRFRAMLGADEPALLMSVVDLFLDAATATLPRLEAALSGGADDRAIRLVAQLGDSAAACAADQLAALLRSIEAAMVTGSPSQASIRALEVELRRVAHWRSSYRPPAPRPQPDGSLTRPQPRPDGREVDLQA